MPLSLCNLKIKQTNDENGNKLRTGRNAILDLVRQIENVKP